MNDYLIALFEQQLREDPKSRVFLRLAEEYRKGKAYEKAIAVCDKGIQNFPDYVPALVCLGRCQWRLNQGDSARATFEKVLAITPDNPHALRGLGEIHYAAGRLKEALVCFESLALHEPNNDVLLDTIHAIHNVLEQEQRAAESTEDDPLESTSPGDVMVGESYDEPEAEELPEEALFEGDISFSTEENIEEGDTSKVMDALDIQFEKAMTEAEASDVRLFADDEPEDAIKDPVAPEIKPSAPLSPDDETLLTLGLKHERMEHFEETKRIYESLLEKYPGNPLVTQHWERVSSILANETKSARKIRRLSNWGDKVKGVYHVS